MSSSTLVFAGARTLVAAHRDALHVVDLVTRVADVQPRADLAGFTVVGDEIWSASGTPLMLEVTGHAERTALDGRTGRFVRGVGAQAVWLGASALHLRRTESGIDAVRLPGVDFALPVGTNRLLVATRAYVQLRDATTRWSATLGHDGRIDEGAVVFDGRAAALWFCQRDRSTLAVLDARTGVVHQRINLVDARLVRFAPARGVALVVVGRRLVLVDLRFGCVLADHLVDDAIADLAIDDAGHQIAMRVEGSDDILELEVEALLRTPIVQAPLVEEVPAPAEAAPAPIVVEEPARAFVFLDPCAALPARLPGEPPLSHEQRAVLDAQRRFVVGLTSQALARAWDEGRAAPDRRLSARELVEGCAGERRGLAGGDVERAAIRAAAATEKLWAVRHAIAPRIAPLDRLATELELDLLEQHVLLVVAAPALWGELASLYGLLVDDPARPLCDEQLVAAILAPYGARHEISAVLADDAILVRSGLVQVVDE